MKNRFYLILILITFTTLIFAQSSNIGIPFIQNYSKEDYKAGTKNWDFIQDSLGNIYIANNEGLLQFNGHDWSLYPLPNKTILRSLALNGTGKIYAGGQDEMGYFAPNEMGVLSFYSLKEKLPESYEYFEDVWEIEDHNEGIFFRASDRIYQIGKDATQVYEFENRLLFLGQANGKVFCQEQSKGLKLFQNGQFNLISGSRILDDTEITSFVSLSPDTILIGTLRNGLFYLNNDQIRPWLIQDQTYIKDRQIESLAIIDNGQIAIGTTTGGILIIDRQRRSKQVITKKHGLQNNTVNVIFLDHQKNIWLGLHNGVDYILTSSPFTTIYPDKDLESASYAVAVFDNYIYTGTSEGLYFSEWKKHYDPFTKDQNFKLVNNSKGEVRSLMQVQDQLLLAHNNGAFKVIKGEARPISPLEGTWTFTPVANEDNYLLSGTYFGLSLYKKEANNWNYQYRLPGLHESSRIISQSDNGDIWVSHPYRGVFKVNMNSSKNNLTVTYPDSIKGLPSKLDNYVYKFFNNIIVGSDSGVYLFDTNKNSFIPYDELNEILGPNNKLRGVFSDAFNNVWYVSREEIGFLEFQDDGLNKKVKKTIFPELNKKLVGGFEFIYPFDEENVFFGAEKGLIHFNPKKANQSLVPLNISINKVYSIAHQDSLVFGGSGQPTKEFIFPNQLNAFRFHFSGISFENWNHIEYSNQLEGLDEKWSSWHTQRLKDYTNLPSGDFIFKVKAKNSFGQESEIAAFPFSIAPPWYASPLAYFIYAIFSIGFMISMILIPRRKFKKEAELLKSENTRIIKVHEQQLEATENEIIQLKNEKLKAEVDHKNQELASATMHLVQKNGLLSNLSKELKLISRNIDNPSIKKKVSGLVKLLESDSNLSNDWEQFAFRFDQVHGDFFKRLKVDYPKLTPKDHRLCAYLRLNLSSKEIAPLMNISVRGVEISRYRLRKKLELENEANLTEFLMNY